MESFERLELSFLLLPSMKISTSIIAPDGTRIAQSSFKGCDCPAEWITALEAMAVAAKLSQVADCPATSRPSPTTPDPSQLGIASRQSPVQHSTAERCAPARKKLLQALNDRQTTQPNLERIHNHAIHFPNDSDEVVTSLPSLSLGSPYPLMAPMIDASRRSLMDAMNQPENGSLEQSLASSDLANESELHPAFIDSCATNSSPISMKRMQKLEAQLETIRDSSIPEKDEFNHTVSRLYQHSDASTSPINSMEQLGHILGRLGNISSVVGIVYSLLSWEIFRWEEDRLIRDEGRPALAAAKQVRPSSAFERLCLKHYTGQ